MPSACSSATPPRSCAIRMRTGGSELLPAARSTRSAASWPEGMPIDVYISVDMEGVAGVATLDQVARGGSGYARAQQLMTDEANAAIAGAHDAGATSVVVNDSHGTM